MHKTVCKQMFETYLQTHTRSAINMYFSQVLCNPHKKETC